MLLTKDNLLRFVKEHKYTTPTQVAKEFETTTTIASAALGELANGYDLKTTHIKFGTTPYYYDVNQLQCLEEIAQKSFSGNELQLLQKIKTEQIVSLNTLSIPERVILPKLQDIYYELKITAQDKAYTFVVWYMRDRRTTQNQIEEALFGTSKKTTKASNNSSNSSSSSTSQPRTNPPSSSQKEQSTTINNSYTSKSQNPLSSTQKPKDNQSPNPFSNLYSSSANSSKTSPTSTENSNSSRNSQNQGNISSSNSTHSNKNESKIEISNTTSTSSSCDQYLYQNGYTIIEKEKHNLGNLYKVSITINEFTLIVDCISIEHKKVQLKEILEFYTSSIRPKIIFHTQLSKKIESTLEELENCFIIQLK